MGDQLAMPMHEFVVRRIAKLRRSTSHKMFHVVASKIMIEEHLAAKELNLQLTAGGIQYAKQELIENELIQQYIDAAGQAWLMVHHALIDEGLSCKRCKYNKNIITKHDDRSVRLHKCKLKETACAYSYWRCAYNVRMQARLYNGLRVRTDSIRKTGKENYNRNGKDKYSATAVDKWKEGEFVAYFNVTFRKTWPNADYLATHLVKGYVRKLKAATKTISCIKQAQRNMAIKEYIRYAMQEAEKQGGAFWTNKWAALERVQEFARTHYESITIQACGKYGIACPYWKEEDCELSKGMCDSSLRKKLIKRYNR